MQKKNLCEGYQDLLSQTHFRLSVLLYYIEFNLHTVGHSDRLAILLRPIFLIKTPGSSVSQTLSDQIEESE